MFEYFYTYFHFLDTFKRMVFGKDATSWQINAMLLLLTQTECCKNWFLRLGFGKIKKIEKQILNYLVISLLNNQVSSNFMRTLSRKLNILTRVF